MSGRRAAETAEPDVDTVEVIETPHAILTRTTIEGVDAAILTRKDPS